MATPIRFSRVEGLRVARIQRNHSHFDFTVRPVQKSEKPASAMAFIISSGICGSGHSSDTRIPNLIITMPLEGNTLLTSRGRRTMVSGAKWITFVSKTMFDNGSSPVAEYNKYEGSIPVGYPVARSTT
jgi:hypothetical protein